VTTFLDIVMDQAALVGLIRRLHGLGVVLVSIVRANTVIYAGLLMTLFTVSAAFTPAVRAFT
jgi:hypothetical protein